MDYNILFSFHVLCFPFLYFYRCQFHQRFDLQIFCTNVVSAAFSSYVLALANNLYEIRLQKTLMKLTAGVNSIFIFSTC